MNEYGEAVGDVGVRPGTSRRTSAWARFAAAATAAVSMVASQGDRAGSGGRGRFRAAERTVPSATIRPRGRSRGAGRRAGLALALGCLLLGAVAAPASSAPEASQAGSGDGWVLSTSDTSKNYSPTFVGNGYLAARVPAAGEGYGGSPVVTQSQLAGFYGAPWSGAEERAGLPSWTTLGFGRSGGVYGTEDWSCSFGQLCPAMYGTISGGADVETDHSGSTVGGFLAGLGGPTVGGTGAVTVKDAPGGSATLAIRYGNGSGSAQTVHLGVNGALQQLTLPDTGGWDSWGVVNVPVTLKAGTNTLEITIKDGDTARVNVDYLAAYPGGAQRPTEIAPPMVGWSCAFDQQCPAMYGTISGGAIVETSHSGSIARGYLAGLNNGQPTVGGTDVVSIHDAPAGSATVAVRYANGSGSAQTVHLGVNGALQQLTLPDTGGWDNWGVVNVPVTLKAGANTLEITVGQDDTARVNVDYLAAYPDGAEPPTQVALATVPVGTTTDYKQSLDLRTGVLATSFDWTSPAGDTTSFDYEVNANRAEGHLGTVSVRAVPHWSGTATVMDEFDGRGLKYASVTDRHVSGKTATLSATVVTAGKLATAGMNSVLRIDDKAVPTEAIADPGDGSAGQSADFQVRAGQEYQITKYVGIAASVDTDRSLKAATPQQAAADTAARAAKAGYQKALARNAGEWSRLWQSSISIPGDATTTAQIHASMFYLLASMRPGVTWSTSPGGLSSSGYSGHVFWDMETWMYPALLAQYPDIAAGANSYRQKQLSAAQANAARLSTPAQPIKGAKFAWESALTGKETAPDPWGTYEVHIDSDIALAQWQYYEATGDTTWLRDKAWPVLKNIADYWATRAVPNASGGYDIKDVMGPDEYNYPVDNSATTNAGAQTSLRIAVRAAGILGRTADPAWSKVADGLKIPVDTTANIHPEFDGYAGQTVKQGDVTLLQYPWGVPMSSSMAQNDLDYYKERTDPNGPSMTDAIAAIDGAALGSPGCQVYNYMRDSADPYLAAPFNQWYETRNGGAFTFTTGEGGYLQEFLYGFTGMRWGTDAVTINPFLPPQLPGVDITGVKWHGRTFDLSVGQQTTKLTLRSGPPLPVRVGSGDVREVASGSALQVPTRHPAGDATKC